MLWFTLMSLHSFELVGNDNILEKQPSMRSWAVQLYSTCGRELLSKAALTHLDVERYSSAAPGGTQRGRRVAALDLLQDLRQPVGRKLLQAGEFTPDTHTHTHSHLFKASFV